MEKDEGTKTNRPDQFIFRKVFSESTFAMWVIRRLLPAARAKELAWDTLRREPDAYIPESLESRPSEILFSASMCEAPAARVYILFDYADEERGDSITEERGDVRKRQVGEFLLLKGVVDQPPTVLFALFHDKGWPTFGEVFANLFQRRET